MPSRFDTKPDDSVNLNGSFFVDNTSATTFAEGDIVLVLGRGTRRNIAPITGGRGDLTSGRLAVCRTAIPAGALRVPVCEWHSITLDTSASSVGAPVYVNAGNPTPSLTPGPAALQVGVVATVATEGKVDLEPQAWVAQAAVQVNAQTSGGYLDINGVRIQFGTVSDGDSDTPTTVSFAQPFGDANARVTLTPVGTNAVAAAIDNVTTTGFDLDRDDAATGSTTWHYIAIGAAP